MKTIRPNVQKPQTRKATPEQLAIRRWFLSMDPDECSLLIRATRDLTSKQAEEYYATAYRNREK